MVTFEESIEDGRLAPQSIEPGTLYSIPDNQLDYSGDVALVTFWPVMMPPLNELEAASTDNSPWRYETLCKPEFGSAQYSEDALERRAGLYTRHKYVDIAIPQRVLTHLRE
jgi:hypothetical protein